MWSFWSRPHRLYYHRLWRSERAHLLCWALSVAEAARHFEEVCLVADEAGAELLTGRLGLPFAQVSTELEALNREGADPLWWVLGKLTAYAAQKAPFVHLDADVILWKPLPARLLYAPVLAQNPEHFDFEDQSLYRIDAFMRAIGDLGGWLPPAWRRYAATRGRAAACCGILGGADAGFISRYARSAIDIIGDPRNQAAWERIGAVRDNILVEQYFLAACLDAGASGRPVRVEYLFPSSTDAFDPQQAERTGFTHLIGEAKADAGIADRLESRVKATHPELYERCMAAVGTMGGKGDGRED
ncbi:MAG TPA: DUF6734 family protein [Caulobacteraceae bacterium]